MRKFTRNVAYDHVDPDLHPRLDELLATPGYDGFIICQNQQLDSRNVGHITAVSFGPACTIKSVEALPKGWHLHDLPSQREYPIGYYRKES